MPEFSMMIVEFVVTKIVSLLTGDARDHRHMGLHVVDLRIRLVGDNLDEAGQAAPDMAGQHAS